MNKKKKSIITITVVGVVVVLLYFVIVNVINISTIKQCYKEFHVEDLGCTAVPFTEYDVTNEDYVTVNTEDYSIALPTSFFNETEEPGIGLIAYKGFQDADGYGEGITMSQYGTDDSDKAIMNILNQENLSQRKKKKIIDGYETLGYGVPDTMYSSLKCIYQITEDDYSFFDRDKAAAYTLLVPYRVGTAFFYSDGGSTTYFYESENMYALISENYIEDMNLYSYVIDFYHPEDLNTTYKIILKTTTCQTAYAIMNSIEFQ